MPHTRAHSGAHKRAPTAHKTDARKGSGRTVEQLKAQARTMGVKLSKDGKQKTKAQLARAIAARR